MGNVRQSSSGTYPSVTWQLEFWPVCATQHLGQQQLHNPPACTVNLRYELYEDLAPFSWSSFQPTLPQDVPFATNIGQYTSRCFVGQLSQGYSV